MKIGKASMLAVMGAFIGVNMAIMSSTVHGGTTVFNFEWVFFFANLILLVMVGYTVRILISGEFEKGIRRSKRGNVLAGALTLIASFVALKLLFEKKPENLVEGGKVGETLEGAWYYVTSGQFKVVLQELPAVFYIVPFLAFLLLVITAKRREKRERVPFEVRFEPEMTYDTIEGTPAERVIRMYRNVVAGLILKGYPYQRSWTHWEHAERVSYMREAFMELTRVFEKAKYAPQKVTWEDAERALETYRKMRGELNV